MSLLINYAIVFAKPNQAEICTNLIKVAMLLLFSWYPVAIILWQSCQILKSAKKLWNLVKMLKSSPLVQKHGMAEGPYTCWDKFCMFYWATWFVIELRISHHIFRVKIFHTKNDSWARFMKRFCSITGKVKRRSMRSTPSPPTQTDLDIYCQLEI